MKFTTLTSMAVLSAALMIPASANAQIFGGNNLNTLIGAGIGGAIGSNLAGGGVQQEGTAIGALLGGMAGSAYSNRYGSNHGFGNFNRSPFMGAGLGAIAGGVLGSNLAGTGVQQEGTAIGAVLGGLAGYGLANRVNRTGYSPSRYGYAPSYGTFGGTPYMAAPRFNMPTPQFMPAPQFIQGPQFVSNSYTFASAPVMQAPMVQPTIRHVYHPAPYVAPVVNRVIHHTAAPVQRVRTVHIYKAAPAPVYQQEAPTRVYEAPTPPPVYQAPAAVYTQPAVQTNGVYCYAGSSKRYNSRGYEITSSSCN